MLRPRGVLLLADGGLSGTHTLLGGSLLIFMGPLLILGWIYQD